MAQKVDEITGMLRDMRAETIEDSEDIKKTLGNIVSKLEILSDTDEMRELIEIYVTELKKAVEEKDEIAIIKFMEIQDDIKNILENDNNKNSKKLSDLYKGLISVSNNIKALNFRDDIENVSSKIAELKNILENKADLNYKGLTREIAIINKNIDDSFTHLDADRQSIYLETRSSLTSITSELQRIADETEKFDNSNILDTVSKLSNDIMQSISSVTADLNDIKSKTVEIDQTEVINSVNKLSDNLANTLYYILENLKKLSSDVEKTSKSNVKESIDDLSNDISDSISSLNETSSSNFETVKDSLEEVASNVNLLQDKFKNVSDALENLKPEDYSANFEVISDKLNSLTPAFDDVMQSVSDVKTDIADIKDANALLVSENKESIENLSNDIRDSLTSITESFENTASNNLSDITDYIKNLAVKIDELRLDTQKPDYSQDILTSLSNLSEKIDLISDNSGFSDKFDELNEKISNQSVDIEGKLLNQTVDIQKKLESESADIQQKLENQSINIQEKIENQSEEMKRFFDEASDFRANLSEKIDLISDNSGLSEKFDELNEKLSNQSVDIEGKLESQSADIQEKIGSESVDIQEKIENQSEEMKNFFDKAAELGANLSIAIESLKENFSQFDERIDTSNNKIAGGLNEKLTALEASLNENTQNYEEKVQSLYSKVSEFVALTEQNNTQSAEKISSYFDEISKIKDELVIMSENLKSENFSAEGKLADIVSLIDANMENIVFNINSLHENLNSGISTSLKEGVNSIEERFSELTNLLSEIKDVSSSNEFENDIYEKITSLKDEFTFIKTDITTLLSDNSENMFNMIENLKSDIGEFVNTDYGKILSDLKSYIDVSFKNLSSEFTDEIVNSIQPISRLEDAYKEAYNKLDVIGEFVTEKIRNDLELINNALETGIKDIKYKFDESVEDKFDSLKTSLDLVLDDTRIRDSINDFRNELFEKFEALFVNYGQTNLRQDEILSGLNSIKESIEDAVLKASEAVISKYKPDQTVDMLIALQDDSSILKNEIRETDSKLDDLYAKFDSFTDNQGYEIDKVENCIEQVNSSLTKVNKEITGEIQNVSSKIDGTLLNTLNSLHVKLDVLAADETNFDLLEEVDEIRDIIFEQHKSFEESSNEKIAAIDSYLKDVLIKIDNLDIEKNSQDIKDTVINTLVSLFEQISFIEESEDIKDFVEEKTNKINNQLLELKDGLKKLTNPDEDDFNYVYTLNDVESDIANLRLAINNLKNRDYSDITEEIGIASERIDKLKEDIVSLSTRTNKLLMNTDESAKVWNDSFNNFGGAIENNKEIAIRLENKLDSVQALAQSSANSDKVLRQTMEYLGEWVDATTGNIDAISEKAVKIPEMQRNIDNIFEETAKISEIQKDIDNIKTTIPEMSNTIYDLKQKFENRENKINELEEKLDVILAKIEDNSALQKKTDKIERLVASLSANIEKLTSYVDE